jgi:ribosomal protein S18 acetylase RimI-like enzyme
MANSIKPASIIDLGAVERVVHDAYVKYVERVGRRPGPMLDDYSARISEGAVWVIEDGSTIIGVLVLLPKTNYLLLDNVAVAPTHQGLGFGRRLLEFAEAEAMRLGYQEIRLYTHETMIENRRLYAAVGYEETGRGTEAGYERVFMKKQLGGAS